MKNIFIILSVILLVGCKSKKVDSSKPEEVKIVKLNVNEVNSFEKNRAYDLGKRILLTCNTSKFKPFTTTEATQSVINNITLDKLSKTCKKYRQFYGDFIDIELEEIYVDKEDATTIFRYKALYTKKVANKELRVYMNQDNKVSGIKSMDWEESFARKR
jgi:hypothetical protein